MDQLLSAIFFVVVVVTLWESTSQRIAVEIHQLLIAAKSFFYNFTALGLKSPKRK